MQQLSHSPRGSADARIGVGAKAYLVSATDQVEIVFVEELCDDFSTECEGHSAIVLAPTHRLLVGV